VLEIVHIAEVVVRVSVVVVVHPFNHVHHVFRLRDHLLLVALERNEVLVRVAVVAAEGVLVAVVGREHVLAFR
jgi:hypothetical protein